MVLRQTRLESTGKAVVMKAWAGAGAAMELAEEMEVSSRTRVANQRTPHQNDSDVIRLKSAS